MGITFMAAARRTITAATALVMAITLLPGLPAFAAPVEAWQPPKPQQTPDTDVRPVKPGKRVADPMAGKALRGVPRVAWPKPGVSDVDVPPRSAAGGKPAARVKARDLPVSIGPAATLRDPVERPDGKGTPSGSPHPGKVRVEVLDRGAASDVGIDGLLLRLRRVDGSKASGQVSVEVDYSGFRNAYGGEWGNRLRLVAMPSCAVATPSMPGCQLTIPVPTRNNTVNARLTADVNAKSDADGSVYAVIAAVAGDTGDYKATSLSPSASWQVSAQSGDFSWSYPLRMPPAVGGPVPSLSMAYSSSSVDGRTAATNSQASWVGEGWEMWSGFIERRYKPCADDTVSEAPAPPPNNAGNPTGDQCWGTLNATLSLNGRATELVHDDATGAWRPKSDDGSRIQLLTDAGRGNGDNDNEYWKVTTVDGTQYFFGLNRMPNWVSGKPETNSVWTMPVFGNHETEPCHTTSFSTSWCRQGWRWNLDQVVDPHGNTMAFYYTRETGYYGRANDTNARTDYMRGGYLARVEYGTRQGGEYSGPAPMRVVFDVADRCNTGATCYDTGGKPIAASWPDTPWDQHCAAAPCTGKLSPTFWLQKRLTKVTTQIWNGSAHSDVESWTLRHEYLDTGDNDAKPLWLRGISHAGHVGGTATVPEVTFYGDAKANRVDGPADGLSALNRVRMHTINNESGGQITIGYSNVDCVKGSRMPATADSNNLRCYPAYWAPPGEAERLDWFHKYVVNQVTAFDQVGGSPGEVTTYVYPDRGAAWHYDDDENFVPAKRKTWSQWRGYQNVTVHHGAFGGPTQSRTDYLYFRGMDGDKLASGGVRDVKITDSRGGVVEDHPAVQGFAREEIVYDGAAVVTSTITDPWIHGPTATRTRTWGTFRAYMTNSAAQTVHTALAGGGWRSTKTATTYDTTSGLPTAVDDLGDVATPNDDRCVRTTYTPNTTTWMRDRASRIESVGVSCTATPTRPDDVLSDVRNYYDGSNTWGSTPTKGDVTRAEEAGSWSGSTPNYVTTLRTTYDIHGRAVDTYDVLNRNVHTAYTPATGGPVTGTAVTDPAGRTTTTTINPSWGDASGVVEPNGKRTDITFDALGRITGVWLPGRSKAGGDGANMQFEYLVRTTGASAITAKKLLPNGSYLTSIALLDGLLRDRQTQTQAIGGGRVISDVRYDTRGLVEYTNNRYFDSGAPSTTLVAPSGTPSSRTSFVYDGAERTIAEIFLRTGVEAWRTTTSYGGDRTHVTPPAGGTATTAIVDGRGRTIEARQYHGTTPSGTYDATKYTYTDRDELSTVEDTVGNIWRYYYDQRGRKIKSEDPDAGTTLMSYNDAGQLTSTTDARGKTLAYTYDVLGRKTGTYEGSTSGTKLAEWVYDTLTNGLGKPTSSTRFVNGAAYTVAVTGYDNALRPTGTSVSIPNAEGTQLAGTYTSAVTYNVDGSVATTTLPAAGGLASETLNHYYTNEGLPERLSSATQSYVAAVSYSRYGELTQRAVGGGVKRVTLSYNWDEPTGRLITASALPDFQQYVTDLTYTYDPAGNVTRITDTPGGGASAETQCFTYDYLRRLTAAWTPSSGDCGAAPAASALGGPAPYWHTYTYDPTGNRTSKTVHAAGGETMSAYIYPGAGQPQPHTLQSVTTTSPGGQQLDTYSYDAAGNTTNRTIGSTAQTLDWDSEGKLTKVTATGDETGTTEYVYDADGNRLIRRDPDSVTAYLPGGTELRLDKTTNSLSCTRYYSHAGATIAVRTNTSLTWLVPDHHNTAHLAVNAADLTTIYRRMTPFGEQRGGMPWDLPGERGFVDGTQDASTGLTHLGAREYEPPTGRFVSVDPLVDPTDPQTLNGYAYAKGSPVIWSDPSGLAVTLDAEGYYHVPSTKPKYRQRAKRVQRRHAEHEMRRRSNRSVHPHGTEVIRHGNSIYINGYKVPPGVDPYLLASKIDAFTPQYEKEWLGGGKIWGDPYSAPLETRALIISLCGASPDLCSGDFFLRVQRDRSDEILNAAGLVDGMSLGGRSYRNKLRSCRANSFVPDTRVLMANGTTKSISEIRVGDKVVATDLATGKTVSREVRATIIGAGIKHLVAVTIDAAPNQIGIQAATITATSGHPFWLPQQQRWVTADALQVGQFFQTSSGNWVQIESIAHHFAIQLVHNLTIYEIHTYYVMAGRASILVHNDPPAASRVPDLTGLTQTQADNILSRNGFSLHSISDGGYATYRASDSSKVTIRLSDGRVTRSSSVDPGPNQKNWTQRYMPDGTPIKSSDPKAHNTGENLAC